MDGEIGVSSTAGQGSTFWFQFLLCPVTRDDRGGAPDSGEAEAVPARESVILYIEDSPSHVQLLETVVESMPGIRLLSAHTPTLGLELAHAHNPDLIILDICLPDMDGYEVLEKLYADDATSEIPIIAVSANAMPRDIEKGLSAGFHRYMTKPINIKELKRVIEEILSQRPA